MVGILYVTEKEDLIITCKSGVTIRTGIKDIRAAGRATQGVKLIRLDEGDEIAAISHIEDQDDEVIETVLEDGAIVEESEDSEITETPTDSDAPNNETTNLDTDTQPTENQ